MPFLILTVTALADDVSPQGRRIEFACDRSHVVATSTKNPSGSFDLLSGRNPAIGRSIREWHISKEAPYVFRIEGIVTDVNVGIPARDADFYIGNLQITNVLHFVGTSDTNGHFSIHVSLQTQDDIKKNLPTNFFLIIDSSSGVQHETHESLKTKQRYLYVGMNNVELHEYEIPFTADKSTVGLPLTEDEGKRQR